MIPSKDCFRSSKVFVSTLEECEKKDDDDEDNYWEKFTTVITTYALAGLGGAYVGASPFLFGQTLVEEINNSLEREDVTTLYAELGGQASIEWAGLSLDFDRRDQNLRPWTRLGAGWADGDDGGAWLRMGGGIRWLVAEDIELDLGWNFVDDWVSGPAGPIANEGLVFGVRFEF